MSATDPSEILSTRVFPYAPEVLFDAFADPTLLAKWWRPAGFSNTFETFEFRPGGMWKFVMHGPDGANYVNESQFVEIARPSKIVFDHLRTMHRFLMTMTYEHEGEGTRLTWRQRFETPEETEKVRQFAAPANEQNFDRLAAVLSSL